VDNNLDAKEKDLLRILTSNDRLNNNEQVRTKLLEYLRKCDADAVAPLDKVFEICIEYFKPPDIDIKALKRKSQKEFVLFLIDNADNKDAIREKYQEVLTELGKEKVETQGRLDAGNVALKQFNANYKRFKNNNAEGVGFAFEIKEHKVLVPGDPLPQIKYYLHYTISDDFLGDTKTKNIELSDPNDFTASMQNTLKNNYINNERQGLLHKKHDKLARDVRGAENELHSIGVGETSTQNSIDNHDHTIGANAAVNDDKRGENINKIRMELRTMYAHKMPEATRIS